MIHPATVGGRGSQREMGESSAPAGLRTEFAVPVFVPLDKGDAALFAAGGLGFTTQPRWGLI